MLTTSSDTSLSSTTYLNQRIPLAPSHIAWSNACYCRNWSSHVHDTTDMPTL